MASCPPHNFDPTELTEARRRDGTVRCRECQREFRVLPAERQLLEAIAEEEGTTLEEAKLSYAQRKSLPKSSFVFPDKAPGPGSYPIHDEAHARNALARSSGKPEEGTVRAAVYRRYPQLKKKD